FLPNGEDCYQRLTDDIPSIGSADVETIWRKLRQRWIDRHTDPARVSTVLMKIPGVDEPLFESGSSLKLVNRQSGKCLSSNNGQVKLKACEDKAQQLFQTEGFDDGKLAAALLLSDSQGRYLHSNTGELPDKVKPAEHVIPVFTLATTEELSGTFGERWYLLPVGQSVETASNPAENDRVYYIESDALQRSFLLGEDSEVRFQSLFERGTQTALPQKRFLSGDDKRLQWKVMTVD
ncbi:MAG: hypothetical protein HKN43_04050, partial [Rhodothermales bacterium]|nr:hypothetical protein [Rhodothermales bacterium]